MRLIDEGIQLEMNVKSMSREELERAYIEAKENEAVYKKFYNCVRKMMIAKLKKKPFVPKKWIERLDIPEMTCEYNADQWSVVCKLKSELEEIAIALGFKNEVIDGYRDKRNQIGKKETKEIVERMHFGKTLEQRKDEYDGKLTVEKEFDWGEPMGKEIW